MASEGSTYGDIHRYEPPRESTAAAVGIVLLTVIQIVLVGLFTYGMLIGWASGIGTSLTVRLIEANMFLGGVLTAIFLDLAFIMLLYRKEFLPDVMIVKKRRRKWEDLYIRQEDVEGETLADEEQLVETIKRAVYPYYKK
ncbi:MULTISPECIES: DUF7318 family protein [Haloarcula]|uniref:Uncharacterized protein n=1 Tax=Haloarcula pellucida TaxID=1427151 RepID=A0A830GFU3_9EURY|nr:MULTISPECIES: hypothetical protein [Halomicroarcula]MBX0346976.1 hypothetical protein [Halomicroarcula pellucida]MDS0277149.1 hypothetical protein [Halomicroarcula sp. S1AR25-4]GGN86361.1 hypothetical protein GCM10009030_03970 [Halomicroarcula pellucida]